MLCNKMCLRRCGGAFGVLSSLLGLVGRLFAVTRVLLEFDEVNF